MAGWIVRSLIAVPLLAAAVAGSAGAPQRKPDLADATVGMYHGAVISDARGSSREGVMVTVARIGPNRVSITSDYRRIPARTFSLVRVMDTIQNTSQGSAPGEVFLAERSKTPLRLSLTIDDAAWSGERHGAMP